MGVFEIRDHRNYNIGNIGQNTEKSRRDCGQTDSGQRPSVNACVKKKKKKLAKSNIITIFVP